MRVLLVGRRMEPLREAAVLAGETAIPFAADIAAPEGREAILRALPGPLHLLVHSAGAFRHGGLVDTSAPSWTELTTVNLHGPLLLTACCLPQLRAGSGQIVFINSTAGLRAGPGAGAYAASKHALRAAADILRQEVNKDGIRVLSIFPGRTATPMQDAVLAAEGRTAPEGTLMRPEDVAAMVLAAARLPNHVEVTDITMRPARPL